MDKLEKIGKAYEKLRPFYAVTKDGCFFAWYPKLPEGWRRMTFTEFINFYEAEQWTLTV